jgi:hypothetical protein
LLDPVKATRVLLKPIHIPHLGTTKNLNWRELRQLISHFGKKTSMFTSTFTYEAVIVSLE